MKVWFEVANVGRGVVARRQKGVGMQGFSCGHEGGKDCLPSAPRDSRVALFSLEPIPEASKFEEHVEQM